MSLRWRRSPDPERHAPATRPMRCELGRAALEVFRQLGDSIRHAIVAMLLEEEELQVKEIRRRCGCPVATVSRQLSRLHAAGLLLRRSAGKRTWYRIDRRGLEPATAWLLAARKTQAKARPGHRR